MTRTTVSRGRGGFVTSLPRAHPRRNPYEQAAENMWRDDRSWQRRSDYEDRGSRSRTGSQSGRNKVAPWLDKTAPWKAESSRHDRSSDGPDRTTQGSQRCDSRGGLRASGVARGLRGLEDQSRWDNRDDPRVSGSARDRKGGGRKGDSRGKGRVESLTQFFHQATDAAKKGYKTAGWTAEGYDLFRAPRT